MLPVSCSDSLNTKLSKSKWTRPDPLKSLSSSLAATLSNSAVEMGNAVNSACDPFLNVKIQLTAMVYTTCCCPVQTLQTPLIHRGAMIDCRLCATCRCEKIPLEENVWLTASNFRDAAETVQRLP